MKFVNRLDHISFDPAQSQAQDILYITERAVFRWAGGKLALTEVPAGIEVDRDVLARMDFRPSLGEIKVTEAPVV